MSDVYRYEMFVRLEVALNSGGSYASRINYGFLLQRKDGLPFIYPTILQFLTIQLLNPLRPLG